jgi:hypothetical protein
MRQLGVEAPAAPHGGRRVLATLLVLVLVGITVGATVGWVLVRAVALVLGLVDVK